jgi:hypothetical protein
VRTEEGNYSFVFRKMFFFVTMRCVLVRAWMLDWGLPLNDKETTNRNDINTQTNDPLHPSLPLSVSVSPSLSMSLRWWHHPPTRRQTVTRLFFCLFFWKMCLNVKYHHRRHHSLFETDREV